MLVFAIETSCDETSVCIMDHQKNIYSHIIYSQEEHSRFGGVVPELASRSHLLILQKITKEAFKQSNIKLKDIDVFAATCGPGLIGGLLVGSTYAKSYPDQLMQNSSFRLLFCTLALMYQASHPNQHFQQFEVLCTRALKYQQFQCHLMSSIVFSIEIMTKPRCCFLCPLMSSLSSTMSFL